MKMSGQLPRNAGGGLWFELTVDPATCELGRDANEASALITVTALRSGRGAAMAASSAEVIIMDRSLSMRRQGKLQAARDAVAAAIDALSEETYFTVIAGKDDAEQVYPADGTLCRATAAAKFRAKTRIANLDALGGTAMGRWLSLARQLFDQAPDAVRHAVLYTDGINEHETAAELDSALRACRDHFVCDVRGVGVDWEPRELRHIADVLQGEADAIIDIADLRADFVRLMEHAQRLLVPRVFLRLSLDRHFRLESVRQSMPVVSDDDLTRYRLDQDGGVTDIPLLSWGEERRDYLVTLRAEPATPASDELRAARVDVLAGPAGGGPLAPCAAPAAVAVRWLPYGDLPSVRNSTTEVQDLMRLADAIQDGVAAYQQGDKDGARSKFRDAWQVANRVGAVEQRDLLRKLVTEDEYGDVRLRPGITRGDLLTANLRSTSHRVPPAGRAVRPAADHRAQPPAIRHICPDGHVTYGRDVRYCEEKDCGYEFGDDDG